MDSEFTQALLRAYVAAMFRREMPDSLWAKLGSDYRHQAPLVLAVARVALKRAAAHLLAEAAGRMAGLAIADDPNTSHLVIGLLRSMADEVEGLLPVEGTT